MKRSPLIFAGAVLAGGASRRFGSDKALFPLGGEPLVVRVARALAEAGARDVFVVGGDRRIGELGVNQIADRHPGEGPLGGVITALHEAGPPLVAVLATDLVAPDPDAIRTVVAALGSAGPGGADVALPVVDGRRHSHHGAWAAACLPQLEAEFAAGERAIKRAVLRLRLIEVGGVDPRALADADTPAELDR